MQDKYRKEKQTMEDTQETKEMGPFQDKLLFRPVDEPTNQISQCSSQRRTRLTRGSATVQASFISSMGRDANVLGRLIHK